MNRKTLLHFLFVLLAAGAVALLVGRVYRPPGSLGNLLWRLELGSYDGRLSTRASQFPDNLVIVAVDDESLQQVGVWPWKRSLHAQLINKLTAAGARLIGMDVLFSDLSGSQVTIDPATGDTVVEPVASADDRALAEAIAHSGRVVLAAQIARDVATRGEEAATTVSSATFPHDLFAAGMLDAGVTDIPRDLDSVVRRAWLFLNHQDEDWPTLPVVLAAHYLKREPMALAREAFAAAAATHPYLEGETALVNFRGPAGTIKTVPYYQVLEGLVPPETFRDKIVLVGGSAAILQDIYPTPMARREPGETGLIRVAPMPGVEVQANVLATLLAQDFIVPVAETTVWLLLVLTALLVIGATVAWRPLRGAVVLVALLAAQASLTTLALWEKRWWVPLAPLVLVALLGYLVATVYMYLTEERARLRMRRAWQQRVSAEVLQVILNNPVPKVHGRTLEATVMFTDLRGFTTMCHTCAPEVVVDRLNEYLTAMTEVIREYGGTIHKFIGDGIMAVFGDPVAHSNHAERAVRAAVAMQARMAELSRSATAAGNEPLRMGIGIHTGALVAGDIGSEALLEYTVIGDTVSTSSRIEGLNKELKTGILLSGQTRTALGETDLPLVHVSTQSVRGRDEDLDLYTVGTTPEAEKAG